MSDGWSTVNTGNTGNIVKLGDKEGQVREVEGVFLGVKNGIHGPLYEFEGKGGEGFAVPHNKALEDLDPETYTGKLVRLTFKGMSAIKGGKTFKNIGITAYEGEPTKAMRKDYPSLAAPTPEAGEETPQPF